MKTCVKKLVILAKNKSSKGRDMKGKACKCKTENKKQQKVGKRFSVALV